MHSWNANQPFRMVSLQPSHSCNPSFVHLVFPVSHLEFHLPEVTFPLPYEISIAPPQPLFFLVSDHGVFQWVFLSGRFRK